MGQLNLQPESICAVIGAVEDYPHLGRHLQRHGLDEQAWAFVRWLVADIKVPKENIVVFRSPASSENNPIQDFADLSKDIEVHPALQHQVVDVLDNLAKRFEGCQLIFFYWVGHGFVDPAGSRRVLFADARSDSPRSLDLRELARMLRTDKRGTLNTQVGIIDACANLSDSFSQAPGFTFSAAAEQPLGLHQEFYFAAPEGQYAQNGVFGPCVFEILKRRFASGEPPWDLLQDVKVKLEKSKSLPVNIVYTTPGMGDWLSYFPMGSSRWYWVSLTFLLLVIIGPGVWLFRNIPLLNILLGGVLSVIALLKGLPTPPLVGKLSILWRLKMAFAKIASQFATAGILLLIAIAGWVMIFLTPVLVLRSDGDAEVEAKVFRKANNSVWIGKESIKIGPKKVSVRGYFEGSQAEWSVSGDRFNSRQFKVKQLFPWEEPNEQLLKGLPIVKTEITPLILNIGEPPLSYLLAHPSVSLTVFIEIQPKSGRPSTLKREIWHAKNCMRIRFIGKPDCPISPPSEVRFHDENANRNGSGVVNQLEEFTECVNQSTLDDIRDAKMIYYGHMKGLQPEDEKKYLSRRYSDVTKLRDESLMTWGSTGNAKSCPNGVQ